MGIFKKRSIAIILAVVVVVGSSAATVSSKINKSSNGIIKSFYDGVVHGGYLHKSIASQLEKILSASDGLVSLASNYGLNVSDVLSASRNLKDALSEYTDDFDDIYKLYDDLMRASNNLIYDLNNQDLSERDESGLSQYTGILDGATSVIEDSGYNEAVRDYYDENSGFLESIFVDILDIDLPETFS